MLVGMQRLPQEELRAALSVLKSEHPIDNQTAIHLKRKLAEEFRVGRARYRAQGETAVVINFPRGVFSFGRVALFTLTIVVALFGKVVRGMETVAAIEATGSRSGKPSERVVIESVTVTEAD